MITLSSLSGAEARTYQKIGEIPPPLDLRRTAVRSLLEALGHVTESPDHRLQVCRNGHVLGLHALRKKKTESKTTVIALRRFLKRSEIPPVQSNGREAHLLLVIGHHEIRLFRADSCGGAIQQLLPDDGVADFTIAEPDAAALERSAQHLDFDGIFEPVANALRATGNILIFGESRINRVKMDHFISWLKQRHPHLASRIVGSEVLSADRLKANPLLAQARRFYAHTGAV